MPQLSTGYRRKLVATCRASCPRVFHNQMSEEVGRTVTKSGKDFVARKARAPACTRGATAHDQRIKIDSLLVEHDATREGLEPRVGAERIETRPQEDAWVEPFFVSLLEPGHRLIS